MEHTDALREMSVEKYLLGELTGAERDTFEEHLFECSLCADDLKNAVAFAEAVRVELPAMDAQVVHAAEKKHSWFDWLFRPQWMAPALAACLVLAGYQNFVRIPALQQELAQAETPHIASSLSMASGALRGGGPLPVVSAKPKSTFVLPIDLVPQPAYAEYVFSILSSSGAVVWKETLAAAAVGDTTLVDVPTAAVQAGKNTLLVQGARRDASGGVTLEALQKQDFVLELQK